MNPWTFRVELPLRSEWASVERVRRAAEACLRTAGWTREQRETLGMVISELVENALKYGDWSVGRPNPARIRLLGNRWELKLTVAHRTAPGSDVTHLFERLREIHDAPSAEQAYLERLKNVADHPEVTSGLGLARVAYEGNCSLAAYVLPDETLEVTADLRPI